MEIENILLLSAVILFLILIMMVLILALSRKSSHKPHPRMKEELNKIKKQIEQEEQFYEESQTLPVKKIKIRN